MCRRNSPTKVQWLCTVRKRIIWDNTLVLNSTVHDIPVPSLVTVLVSPSSIVISPKRIPRVYMFGMVITYSE